MKQRENIKISGHKGTWHIIKDYYYYNKSYYLLEHETYGEDAGMLWVDEENKIVLDEVFNGLDDLLEFIEEEEANNRMKLCSGMVITSKNNFFVSEE